MGELGGRIACAGGGSVVTLAADARFLLSDVDSLVRAAIDGLGFPGIFEGYLADAIADGRLVRVPDDWWPSFPGPFLYDPSSCQPASGPGGIPRIRAGVASARALTSIEV
jgi:hypothetical protein